MKRFIKTLAPLVLLAVAACGDDGGGGDDDGDPPVNSCATAELAITTVPGTVSGTVKGKGSDISVAESACADEAGYFAPDGEDNVVSISGLTPGQMYGLTMTSEDDLSMYIVSACPTGGDATGCLVFSDVVSGGSAEAGVFTATASEMFLVVDYSTEFNTPADVVGDFTVEVVEAQCNPNADEATCSLPTPFCGPDFQCHECGGPLDCTNAAEPVCSRDSLECIAGPMLCVGDDTRDEGNGDDAPTVAFMLTPPTAGVPTTIAGKICSSDRNEADWYKVTLAAAGDLGFTLDIADTVDVDLFVFKASGERVDSSESNAGITETILAEDLAAGTYLIQVVPFVGQNGTPSTVTTDYTLTLNVPECSPDTFLSCTDPAKSVCGGAGICAAGPAQCTGDDAGDPNDDGPAGARTLTTNVAVSGNICTLPRNGESDFYKFVAAPGENDTITLAWTGATVDMDLIILDDAGKVYGQSVYVNPEIVKLTNLPAGTYYAVVTNFIPSTGTPAAAGTAYTITRVINGVGTCTTSTQCATEHKTQVFRSVCTAATGVCSFDPKTTGALGASCDSNSNCGMDGLCSYLAFESDAEKSVCVPGDGCDATADCTAAGATLTCTSGFVANTIFGPIPVNQCVPACASDLECGANLSKDPADDAALPWIYNTCATPGPGGVCTQVP